MAGEKPRDRKDKYSGVKYAYVIDKRNGQPVVLDADRPGLGVLDQSAVFYDPEKHKGHIVCPDCEVADMIHIDGYRQGGNNIHVRNHFKKAAGSQHAPGCISDLRMDQKSDPKPDNKDYTKGPVIFLNALVRNIRPKFRDAATGRVSYPPSLVIRDEEGIITLTDPDLANRERFSAKTPADFFRIMKSLSPERLKDSRIVHGDTVTPWKNFLIRLGNPQAERPDFARFINLARDLVEGQDHPVMLHFKAAVGEFRPDNFRGKTSYKKALRAFVMPDPEAEKGVLRVIPLVTVRDIELVKNGGSFFALSKPVLKPSGRDQSVRFMIFNVDKDSHIAAMGVEDLAGRVGTRIKDRSRPAAAPV